MWVGCAMVSSGRNVVNFDLRAAGAIMVRRETLRMERARCHKTHGGSCTNGESAEGLASGVWLSWARSEWR
jgi:hypothetical protein